MSIRAAVLGTLTLLVLAGFAHPAEEHAAIQFDGARAKQYVEYLSRDDLQGRMTCTEGYRKVADWAAGRFKTWGLTPAGDEGSYFQQVTIRDLDWTTGVPALHVAGREFLLDDGDYALDSLSTPGVQHKAVVVFVGYGISAPKKGLDEYADLDVNGKIVLALTGSPKDAPEQRSMFRRSEASAAEDGAKQEDENWKAESSDSVKIKTAYDKGAAAILLYNPVQSSSGESSRRSYSRRSRGGDFIPERDFLCYTINERIFRAIMRQDPQLSPRGLTRQLDAMRREIKEKRSQSRATSKQVFLKGYDTRVHHDEEHKNNIARNVLAKIDGSDPKMKEQFVLVGAHLDHVGMRNGYVYNGADDNASGSAVVLELARMLAERKYQPKRTIVFCLWCGEERGLLGSYHYTKNPCGGVRMDDTVAYFNLDMVGLGDVLGAPGALNFPSIWDVIRRGQDPELMKKIKPAVGGTGGSDHSGFIRKGIEALALMSQGGVGHPDYHQPEDDSHKIDPEMMRVTGQFVACGLMNLADETKAELLIPRRKELYEGLRMRVANYNPLLENSTWTQVELKAKSGEELEGVIYDLVREFIKKGTASGSQSSESSSGNGFVKKSVGRGLGSLQAVGTDERLLDLAIDFYGIGRIDVSADDALWFQKGELTEDAKKLIKALEARKVVIHVISPTVQSLQGIVSAASKPFVVSGEYELSDDVTDSLKRLGCPLGVTLDPANPNAFLSRVEKLKQQLGERQLLFAMLENAEKLDDVKQAIYMGLLDRGWAHNEIVGGREHRGLMGGATLRTLAQ